MPGALVIGGGLAGIAAARALGRDAHLVEAIDPRLLLGLLAACVAGRETRGGT